MQSGDLSSAKAEVVKTNSSMPLVVPVMATLGLHSYLDFGVCFLLHKTWQCKCVELQDLVSIKAIVNLAPNFVVSSNQSKRLSMQQDQQTFLSNWQTQSKILGIVVRPPPTIGESTAGVNNAVKKWWKTSFHKIKMHVWKLAHGFAIIIANLYQVTRKLKGMLPKGAPNIASVNPSLDTVDQATILTCTVNIQSSKGQLIGLGD